MQKIRYYCIQSTLIFPRVDMLNIRNKHKRLGRVILSLLFAICGISKPTQSKEYVYREKILNILPNNFNREINCITTDKYGFIWAGTNQGLYRYDGYNTDPILFYNKNSFSLSPEVNDIGYSNKHIYLATNRGLYVVETTKETYSAHPVPELSRENLVNIYPDEEDGIWFIATSGIIGNIKNSKVKKIALNIPFQLNQVLITEDKQHLFLTLRNNKIISINKEKKEIEKIWTFKEFNYVSGLNKTPSNDILICTEKGVFMLNNRSAEQPTLTPTKIYGDSVSSVLYANEHIFVNRLNSSIDNLIYSNGQYKTNKLISNKNNILHINRSKWYHNQLLIPGRLGLGIIQVSNNYFKTIVPVTNAKNGDTRGIAEDDNYYYLCTYKNIYRYNKATGVSETISNEDIISHAAHREKDTLWIATDGSGLVQFNLKTFKITKLFSKINNNCKSTICIKQLNKDTLILGSFKKIIFYNKTTKKITPITPKNKLNQEICNGYYRDILIIDNNKLLVATSNGVFEINMDGRLIREFGKEKEDDMPENTNSIWLNNKKQVWIGTSNGIVIYDTTGKFLTRINYQNGLSGNKIAGMVPDKFGKLWVGSYTGLSSISISDLEIKNYYTEDGLPDNEFNHSSFFADKNGNIVMGTMQGFIQITPQNIVSEAFIPSSILISKIERERNGKIESDILTNEQPLGLVQLGKGINYLKLYICRLPIQFFSECNFNYKILELLPQNVSISDKPMITLTDTEIGKFDIEINMNDGKGTNGIYYKLITYQCSEYFYSNKWFYLFFVLLFLLLAIGYLYTLVIQKNKNLNIRNEIARDLHDEIGGSLTAISLYTELLRTDKSPTQRQIESIQQTTRKLLLSFRDALWTLNTESDTALQLWDHIKDMTTEIAYNLNIKVEFDELPELENIKLSLDAKRNLLLALKEGINNAIKHGNHDIIKLNWIKKNEKHKIIIKNSMLKSNTNSKFTSGLGLGLNSMKKRMEDIGGKISFNIENDNFEITYHLNFLK